MAGEMHTCSEPLCMLLQEAAGNGAEMVVLPEMWNCPYSNESFPTFAEDIEGDSSQSAAAMAAAAKQHGITLVAGSIPEKHDGHLYNTCLVYDRQGQRLARFRKVIPAGPNSHCHAQSC